METISRHLEDLRAFHCVAISGSYTQAAQTLGQSKSQVSKQVQRLEVALRAKLFLRTTRTLKLTEAGESLLTYSHRILNLTREADERIQHLQGDRGGKIRISMPVSFGEFFAPDFLREARAALPETEFEIDLSNEQIDFFREQLDFALRASEDHHPDLIARYLGHLRDVIVASPDHLATIKPPQNPKQLGAIQCILHSMDPAWNHWTLRSPREEIKIEVRGKISTNQYSAALALCRAGHGIARIPYYLAKDALDAGELRQIFPEFESLTHPLYLVYPKQEYAAKKNQVAKKLIERWFKRHRLLFAREQSDAFL